MCVHYPNPNVRRNDDMPPILFIKERVISIEVIYRDNKMCVGELVTSCKGFFSINYFRISI